MNNKKETIAGLFIRHTLKYKWRGLAALCLPLIFHTCEIIAPLFYKYFFDILALPGNRQAMISGLLKVLTMLAAVYLLGWFTRLVSTKIAIRLVPQVMTDITNSAYQYISGHSYKFFTDNFAGSIVRKIQRLSSSYNALENIMVGSMFSLIITCIGSVIMLSSRNLTIGMIIAAWIIVVTVGNFIFSKGTMVMRRARAAKDSETTAVLSDAVSGAINVKQFNGISFERSLVSKVANELGALRYATWNRSVNSQTLQTAVLLVLEIVVMYFAIVAWSRNQLTIGDFALIQAVIVQLWSVVWNIIGVFKDTSEALADAQEGIDLLNMPYDIVDVRGAKKLKATSGAVSFDHVQFNYNETREVLPDFTLDIKPKEKVALVGPSGAGKSTIVKILLRYYDLTSGKITIDGQDIAKATQESLRDAIAMVPQDPILFHRSLLDNIRYGRRQATDKEVYEAAKKAHCHEFIEELPDGYNTFVGERGIKLSGGERQRVAIARAILKNAPILILDEATSSLDSESEALIQDALKALMKDKTVIVIAHRLSTIMEMDRIVVVEDGRVTDTGSHQALLQRAGTYQKLWNIQAGGFIA